MFHVYAPSTGDLLFYAFYASYTGLRVGLYAPRSTRPPRKYGLKPHTWDRDQFNNSNCEHLNIEGSLYSFDGLVGFSQKSGPIIYADEGKTTFSLAQLQTPKDVYSHLLTWGVASSVNFRSFMFDRWYGWIETNEHISVTFLPGYKMRLYVRRTSRVNNVTSYDMHLVTYTEYSQSFSRIRSKTYSIPKGKTTDVAPRWLDITGAFVNSNAYTIQQTAPAIDFHSSRLRAVFEDYMRYCRTGDLSSFGQLSVDAAQGLKVFDGQLSLLIRDILDTKQILTTVKTALGNVSLKSLSSVFLSYRYGLKLTVKDLTDLLGRTRTVKDGTKGYSSSRARRQTSSTYVRFGSKKVVSHDYNMKLYVRDYPNWVIEALQKLMIADFFPTLELVWDIIPFSFVVDWFVNVGDQLEKIDSNTLLSTYKILSCVYSRKSTMSASVSEIFPETMGIVFGTLTVSYYSRHISRKPPLFSFDLSTPKSFNHWIEGSALIAQRGRV